MHPGRQLPLPRHHRLNASAHTVRSLAVRTLAYRGDSI